MYSRKDILDIADMALLAGRILLENGAETYRVEDTINRLCRAKGLQSVDNFTIPTGIFMSVAYGDELITRVQTVRARTIDLEIIALINDFSRSFTEAPMGVAEAVAQLRVIEGSPHYPEWLQVLAGGVGGSFFAILFGASWGEFPLVLAASCLVMVAYNQLSRWNVSTFMSHVLCGAVNMTASLALVTVAGRLGFTARPEMLAIGALMPLVPGVSITNALRDIISGDYVSGMSRILEAFVIAVGIAIGVGVVLRFSFI